MYVHPTIAAFLGLLQVIAVLGIPSGKILERSTSYYSKAFTYAMYPRDTGVDLLDRRATPATPTTAKYPAPQNGGNQQSQVKNNTSQQLKEFCTTVSNSEYLGTPLYTFKNPSLDHLDASGVQDWIDQKCVSYQHKTYPQYNPDTSGHFDDDKTETKNLIVENGGRIPGSPSEYAITCENIKIKGEQWYSGHETLAQTKQLQENNIKAGTTHQVLASYGIQSTPGVPQCHH